MQKCAWATATALEEAYHDCEWGVPCHDERVLFEFLLLEGVQAGLSWRTVLNKREHYRAALDQFDAEKIASYNDAKLLQLLANPNLIRNRLKMQALVTNAQAFLRLQVQTGSFDRYVWQFVDGKTLHNHWQQHAQIPAYTAVSEQLSRDLKQRGFKFVGRTICYAYMQAVGLVNDHTVDCFRHAQLSQA